VAFKLQIVLGPERGREILIHEGVYYVVGRAAECGIVLQSELVSRLHASIRAGVGGLRLSDEGSRCGTFVNGRRVKVEVNVVDGDVLVFGELVVRLHQGEPPPLAPNTWLEGRHRPESGPPNEVIMMAFRGSLAQIPAPSLLRYLAVLKKSGTCVLSKPEQEASIELVKGAIGNVVVDGQKRDDRGEALSSLFNWAGTFDLEPSRVKEGSRPPVFEGSFDLSPPTPRRTAALLSFDDVLPALD
jgi:hypothetical protein